MSASVILIDADATCSDRVGAHLRLLGYEVEALTDANDLLARNGPAPSLTVLCIDPKRTGWALCNRLRKSPTLQGMMLILTSAEATEKDFADHSQLRTRADDYLHKPYTLDALAQKISALIGVPMHTASHGSLQVESAPLSLDSGEILLDDSRALRIGEPHTSSEEMRQEATGIGGPSVIEAAPAEVPPASDSFDEDFNDATRVHSDPTDSDLDLETDAAFAAISASDAPARRTVERPAAVAPEEQELPSIDVDMSQLDEEPVTTGGARSSAAGRSSTTRDPVAPIEPAPLAPSATMRESATAKEGSKRPAVDLSPVLSRPAAGPQRLEEPSGRTPTPAPQAAPVPAPPLVPLGASTLEYATAVAGSAREAQAVASGPASTESPPLASLGARESGGLRASDSAPSPESGEAASEGGGAASQRPLATGGASVLGGASRDREVLALREQLTKKDKEILDLRDSLSSRDRGGSDTRERLRELERRTKEAEDRLAGRERELTAAREKIDVLTADKERAGERERQTKGRFEDEKRKWARLEEEHEALKGNLAREVAVVEQRLAGELQRLAAELSRVQAAGAEALEVQRSEAQRERARLEAEREAIARESSEALQRREEDHAAALALVESQRAKEREELIAWAESQLEQARQHHEVQLGAEREQAKRERSRLAAEQQAQREEQARLHGDALDALRVSHEALQAEERERTSDELAERDAIHQALVSDVEARHRAELDNVRVAFAAAEQQYQRELAATVTSHHRELESVRAEGRAALIEARAAHAEELERLHAEQAAALAEQTARQAAELTSSIASRVAELEAAAQAHSVERLAREQALLTEQTQLRRTAERLHAEELASLRESREVELQALEAAHAEALAEARAEQERLLATVEQKHQLKLQALEAAHADLKLGMQQRHQAELEALRAEARRPLGRLESELDERSAQLRAVEEERGQLQQLLDDERKAARQLRVDMARATVDSSAAQQALIAAERQLEQRTSRLTDVETELAHYHEQVVRAYQQMKSDELAIARTRKALAIALTVLDDARPPSDEPEK